MPELRWVGRLPAGTGLVRLRARAMVVTVAAVRRALSWHDEVGRADCSWLEGSASGQGVPCHRLFSAIVVPHHKVVGAGQVPSVGDDAPDGWAAVLLADEAAVVGFGLCVPGPGGTVGEEAVHAELFGGGGGFSMELGWDGGDA